ncbi:MAG: hypothetical protein JXA10_07460 [Anaerolineae bacterium]|nr:hypothetical protein [Anaerolineae bacterium]
MNWASGYPMVVRVSDTEHDAGRITNRLRRRLIWRNALARPAGMGGLCASRIKFVRAAANGDRSG